MEVQLESVAAADIAAVVSVYVHQPPSSVVLARLASQTLSAAAEQ